ncbi:hypothetical protein TSOC_004437 [Tetrabaena socialis]|uniref:Carboxylesterase type B domain-containing protein n=1 Tax=Tetrabaena socialis TaxID=47790 RepID=A0A2J8A8W9_9CHLO|nr:hypothetical protein TSOC_004437 [Tetrabaena socialis]|eukprot:PNH08986.1 hypothetical protein TSOC_004437 [Tetrabaena socialis]
MGVMAKEGLIFLLGDILASGALSFEQWRSALKGWFHVPPQFESRIYEQYNADRYYGSWTYAANAAITDGAFHCATRRAANYFSVQAPVHVFVVQETRPNSGCSVKQEYGTSGADFTPELVDALGAFHGYDVPLQFMNPYATPRINGNCSYTPNEAQLSSFMSGVWSAMAATGSPLPPLSRTLAAPQLQNISWPQWTSTSQQLLNLDFAGPQIVDLTAETLTCKVWDDMMDYFDSVGTFYPTESPPPPPPPAKAKRPPPRKLGRQSPPYMRG